MAYLLLVFKLNNRGNDISVIGNKVILALVVIISPVALAFNLGSKIDPLGYNVLIKK